MKILRLPAIEGRTFVCGDLHGSYSCVTRFLSEINFDTKSDRLICAGDLVDRGPNNEACLDLIQQPWFYCVMGNHEQLMVEYFIGGYYGNFWGQNGGHWGTRYTTEQTVMGDFVRKMVKHVQDLPYLITVEKNDGTVYHVLHAELPPQQGITDETLSTEEGFTQIAQCKTNDGDTVIWGRYIYHSLYREHLNEKTISKYARRAALQKLGIVFNEKLSPIYSGHTIMRAPVRFMGQTNLDTMAFGSYSSNESYFSDSPEWAGLTITEPETDRFWFSNDREFKEVQPVIIPILHST